MKRFLLPAAILMASCSTPVESPPPQDAALEIGADAPSNPDAPSDAATAPDGPASDVVGPSAPFTAVPYRSDTAQRMFPGAETILVDGRDYRAVIETDVGRIVLDLFEDRTPLAVNSFVYLALYHFYEGIAFHRVIEGFVAQGGDPNTLTDARARWGSGGPGYGFDTETFDDLGFNGPGVLGMARSAARDSNGSQFFITLAAQRSLNGNYTVFGRVTEGMAVLPMIARNQTMTTPPTTPTRIVRVTIESRPR